MKFGLVEKNSKQCSSVQDTGYIIQKTGYRILDTGYRIQDTTFKISTGPSQLKGVDSKSMIQFSSP